MNKTIEARKAIYRWLYEQRVKQPGLFFHRAEIGRVASEPYFSAALDYGLESGHLEKWRGHFRLTAHGVDYAEAQGLVGDEDHD